MIQRRNFLKTMGVAGTAMLSGTASLKAAIKNKHPNIVLIMGDDIGWADIGCWGAEIETPNLDRIGMKGMRFHNFYNMAKCNPTRSCMLTGTFIGGKNSQSLGDLMGKAGYTTLYSGKEHFDKWIPKERLKAMNCFDKSFTHYGGCGNFFSYKPITFHLNEKKLEHEEIEHETEPYFKTNAITDYAIRFLEESKNDKKPFFLYVPYEAAHYPLQALPEDIAKFKGRYKEGWEVIRQRRFEKQKKLGFFKEDIKMSPPTGCPKGGLPYTKWEDITDPAEKKDIEMQMEVFAAMIHCMDRNIGRILKKVEEMGELENTLFMYLSDNGSCAFKRNRNDLPPGGPESYRSLHSAWANVGDTPFRLFKQNGHEGGARTHFMAYWPGVIKPGKICRDTGHIVDIMPTMLELAGGKYPDKCDGEPTPKLDGRSLTPLFEGKSRPKPEFLISGWTEGKRMIRSGDWKLVTDSGGEKWELFNMAKDEIELNDLAEKMPEKVDSLLNMYAQWRKERPYLPEKQSGGSSGDKKKNKDKKNARKNKKKGDGSN